MDNEQALTLLEIIRERTKSYSEDLDRILMAKAYQTGDEQKPRRTSDHAALQRYLEGLIEFLSLQGRRHQSKILWNLNEAFGRTSMGEHEQRIVSSVEVLFDQRFAETNQFTSRMELVGSESIDMEVARLQEIAAALFNGNELDAN